MGVLEQGKSGTRLQLKGPQIYEKEATKVRAKLDGVQECPDLAHPCLYTDICKTNSCAVLGGEHHCMREGFWKVEFLEEYTNVLGLEAVELGG